MSLATLFGNQWFPAKPAPPAAPTIPEAYYGRKPSYIPFDPNIPASDLKAINEQQKRRNLAFEEWISAVADVSMILGSPLAYKIVVTEPNDYFNPIPTYTRLKIPTITVGWEGAYTHYHMDIWPPAQAALVAVANAKDSLLFTEPAARHS